jgi:cell division protein FtsI (penicillin-binding protein 3)
MTLLQMADMYQTIANDGVRIPPRIVKAAIAADGTRTEEPQPNGIRVVSPDTARTVRNMFRAIVQRDPMGYQQGTGPAASVDGYQIAGKTGTAQQINPGCRCYYGDVYWITFAGMAPADDPRYVIGIMMDNPQRNADGSAGHSAAPLFHNIAAWLLQRQNIPLSADPGAPLILQAT